MSDDPLAGAAVAPPLDGPAAPPPRRRHRWLIDVAAVAALLVLLAYLHTRVVQVTFVTTGSMLPTIEPGDRLVVHLAAYRKAPPRRGDVIAFWDPARGELEVKRVIAVGGDEVIVGGGMVIVNGQRLDEPYLREPMLREIPLGGRLAEDQLFVMGDNRNGSEDSRDFGPLAYDRVMGRLVYRILPLNRAGPLK